MRKERGQVLVLVALLLVVLLGFVGLAIDGGRLYTSRRQTQNAADAAALAGARVLAEVLRACKSGSVSSNDAVAKAVEDMIIENGYDDPAKSKLEAWYVDKEEVRLGSLTYGSAIPNRATGVEVDLEFTDETTFMKVLGRDEMTAGAMAIAMAGPVKNLGGGGGMLPIAVPLEVVSALEEEETFYMLETKDSAFCRDPDGVDCIGDTSANSQRGWLNMNYIYNQDHRLAGDILNRSFEQNVPNRGCGSDPNKSVDDGLKGWAGEDKGQSCPYPFPIFAGTYGALDGDFIHGDPGARQSSMHAVVEAYNNKIAYVPIFDIIYTSDYMDENLPAPENPADGSLSGSHWPKAGGGGGAYLYHIVGFAVVRIDDPNSKDHTLVAEFLSTVVGSAQIVPSDGVGGVCTPSSLIGVTLWK